MAARNPISLTFSTSSPGTKKPSPGFIFAHGYSISVKDFFPKRNVHGVDAHGRAVGAGQHVFLHVLTPERLLHLRLELGPLGLLPPADLGIDVVDVDERADHVAEAEEGEEHGAHVGAAIAIHVIEAQQLRRRRDEQRAIVPQDAHRDADAIDEDRALVEDAVAVGVREPADAALGRLGHREAANVFAGRFSEEEPAAFVKRAEHRVRGQFRPGSERDLEALRHAQGGEAGGGGRR